MFILSIAFGVFLGLNLFKYRKSSSFIISAIIIVLAALFIFDLAYIAILTALGML